MIALIRTELLKLRTTRSILVMLAGIAALGLLQVARLVRSAGSVGGVRPGSDDAWTQLLAGGMAGTLLVLLIGVLAVTGEIGHGSLTPTLLVSPRRGRVLAAAMAASALTGAGVAAVMAGSAAAAGVAGGVLTGAPGPAAVVPVAGGVLLSALWGWFGVALGVLIRHQVPALVVPLVWLLVVETMITSYGLGALRWWLPGGAGLGLAGADSAGALPAGLAAMVLAGYGAVASVLGLRRFANADLT